MGWLSTKVDQRKNAYSFSRKSLGQSALRNSIKNISHLKCIIFGFLVYQNYAKTTWSITDIIKWG